MKQVTRITGLSALISPAAFAHSGHEVSTGLLHGLLHTEHLLALLAIVTVAVIGFLLRD